MPLWRCSGKSCGGPQAMAGRKPPERYWRSYGDDPLPAGAEAMHEPFAAFPSWLMRIRCDRCGKDRFLVETHFDRRDMLLRDIIQAHAPRWLWRPGWQGRVVDRHRGRHQPAGAADRADGVRQRRCPDAGHVPALWSRAGCFRHIDIIPNLAPPWSPQSRRGAFLCRHDTGHVQRYDLGAGCLRQSTHP